MEMGRGAMNGVRAKALKEDAVGLCIEALERLRDEYRYSFVGTCTFRSVEAVWEGKEEGPRL